MPRFFTRAEVAKHNNKDDCWVIAHGRIIDVTELIAAEPYELCRPILEKAGDEVSHWFVKADDGSENLEVKTHVHPVSNLVVPYLPEGTFPHVPEIAPTTAASAAAALEGPAWWNDPRRIVGSLTSRAVPLKVVNTLTSQEDVIEVCKEDTVAEIQRKFLEYNAHATSYAWKAVVGGAVKPLDGRKTLWGNGVPDEIEELETLGMDAAAADNVITVLLYFTDDLTEA